MKTVQQIEPVFENKEPQLAVTSTLKNLRKLFAFWSRLLNYVDVRAVCALGIF